MSSQAHTTPIPVKKLNTVAKQVSKKKRLNKEDTQKVVTEAKKIAKQPYYRYIPIYKHQRRESGCLKDTGLDDTGKYCVYKKSMRPLKGSGNIKCSKGYRIANNGLCYKPKYLAPIYRYLKNKNKKK